MGRLIRVAGTIFLATLVGCGGEGSPSSPPQPPRPATLTILSGDNQSGPVGAVLSQMPMVRVSDQASRPLAGATVSWTVTSGGGTVDRPSTVTAADGTTSVSWTLGTLAGTNSLTAANGGLTTSFVATGMPGPLASITITAPANPIMPEDVVQLAAAGTDAYGNAVSLAPLNWTSSNVNVAQVAPSGLLFALHPGPVSVSAQSGGITGSLPLTVNARITFSFGQEEIVFRHSTDSCEPLDVPDVPAHPVRLADGSLMLVAGNAPRNFLMFGADFSSLRRSCVLTLASDDDWYAPSYNNQEWLHAVYREGDVVHALIHNEYHDPFAPNCYQGNTSAGNPCWYNSITYASSTDGGQTFSHVSPPNHVAAPPPMACDAASPSRVYGYFNPSNIVQAGDGYYYSMFMAIDKDRNQGMCVMRTQTLADPTNWRAWDGTGYNLQMTSPYSGPAPAMCTRVSMEKIGGLWGSLTYNTYLGKWLLVGGTIWGWGTPEIVCGIGYSVSADLVNWSLVQMIRPGYFMFSPCLPPGGQTATWYPSIIDHDDTTVNFEKSGRTPYLYFTRFNNLYLNRDLVRVPIIITQP